MAFDLRLQHVDKSETVNYLNSPLYDEIIRWKVALVSHVDVSAMGIPTSLILVFKTTCESSVLCVDVDQAFRGICAQHQGPGQISIL